MDYQSSHPLPWWQLCTLTDKFVMNYLPPHSKCPSFLSRLMGRPTLRFRVFTWRSSRCTRPSSAWTGSRWWPPVSGTSCSTSTTWWRARSSLSTLSEVRRRRKPWGVTRTPKLFGSSLTSWLLGSDSLLLLGLGGIEIVKPPYRYPVKSGTEHKPRWAFVNQRLAMLTSTCKISVKTFYTVSDPNDLQDRHPNSVIQITRNATHSLLHTQNKY